MLLTGCASSTRFATLTNGACSAFPAPAVQIKGRTQADQRWADETTEAGIAGCGWKRPARRPAAMDARPVAAAPVPEIEPLPPTAFVRHHWWDRFRKPRAAVPAEGG